MYLNGREVKFAYTAAAYLDYNDYLVKNEQVSLAMARVQLAVIMNRAYLKTEGIKDVKPITVEELLPLKYAELEELLQEAELQRKEDSTQTVEVKEKNGKSAEKTV